MFTNCSITAANRITTPDHLEPHTRVSRNECDFYALPRRMRLLYTLLSSFFAQDATSTCDAEILVTTGASPNDL